MSWDVAVPSAMTWWPIAFDRVEPGQQPEKIPEGIRTWTIQTITAMTASSLYGGYRGLKIAKTSAPSPVPANNALHRASIFFVRESILTSAKVGLFVATFSSLALTIEHLRKTDDPANYAVAGGVTCGLFGGAIGGWFGFFPSAAFGTALGGASALAKSSLQKIVDDAVSQLPPDSVTRDDHVKQSIEALIDRYETQLQNHPASVLHAKHNAEPRINIEGTKSPQTDATTEQT